MKETISVTAAAKLAGVHRDTIYKWLRSGRMDNFITKKKTFHVRYEIDRKGFENFLKEFGE